MKPERWKQLDQLFHEALALPPDECDAFLSDACAGEDSLRHQVEALLSAHGKAGSFLEKPALEVEARSIAEDQTKSAVGQTIGHYKIISQLGAGGMGEVYLAEDQKLDRRVALKILNQEFNRDESNLKRFVREAKAASALNHPNILVIHEIGESEAARYIVSEFIDGKTLRERLTHSQMGLDEVLDVAIQIAGALSAAHGAHLVHRDIKPENIMIRPDGYVKVLDFGLAKLVKQENGSFIGLENAATRNQTAKGLILGTVNYMSPEQAKGERVDERTDIFSFGVVIYEMIAGRTPFARDSMSETFANLINAEPQPLSRFATNVPDELTRIVSKMLCKNKDERYQLMKEILTDLKDLRADLTSEERLARSHSPDSENATGVLQATTRDPNKQTTAAARTSDVAPVHPTSSAEYVVTEMKRHKRSLVLAAATLIIAVAGLGSYFYFARNSNFAASGEAINSIAILPFVNVNNDPNTEYLSDGISNSVINSLSRLPNLRIISLRSKDKQIDAQKVGRELNVQAVLVGRMTQQGDALRITTELVDVRDNRQLWNAQYDRKTSDILLVQNQIAQEIAEALRLKLTGVEKQRLTKHNTESVEAYDAYARGRFLLEKRTGPATEKSIEYFEQAIKLDPNYALAYASLSYAYGSLPLFMGHSLAEVSPKANAAAAKALALDDTLAEAYSSQGWIKQMDRDWAGAERAYRRAVDLSPNSGFAHSTYAFHFITMKRFDEAVAESRLAVELEPTSVLFNRNFCMNLYFARRYDEAIQQCKKTLELDPNMPTAYLWLAKSYERKRLYAQAVEAYLRTVEFNGSDAEAVSAFRQAYVASGWEGFWRKALVLKLERAKQGKASPVRLAENYARLGDKEQAFVWLDKLLLGNGWELAVLNSDPAWDEFRSDAGYSNLIRQAGLER